MTFINSEEILLTIVIRKLSQMRVGDDTDADMEYEVDRPSWPERWQGVSSDDVDITFSVEIL